MNGSEPGQDDEINEHLMAVRKTLLYVDYLLCSWGLFKVALKFHRNAWRHASVLTQIGLKVFCGATESSSLEIVSFLWL